jgi:sortase A
MLLAVTALAACSTDAARKSGAQPRPASVATPAGVEPSVELEAAPLHSDGRPRRALLSVPAIGLRELPVLPYEGYTDDARGTTLQDGGVAASPHGPRGGTGPGGLGNYQVTAHRTSSTRAFADLPQLRRGQRVVVEVGTVDYVYVVTSTRWTSFRSPRSLAEQRASVPGRPGVAPTRAYVTLSTCATPEDHAAGNFWADEFSNPEHRIDKIGVLVEVRRGPGGDG